MLYRLPSALLMLNGIWLSLAAVPIRGADLLPTNDLSFGMSFYQQVGAKPGNLLFSPLSLSTALAMTLTGARGLTEKQMSQAACLPFDAAQILRMFGELMQRLNTSDGLSELRLVNSLWAQKKFPFLPEFMKSVQETFGARVENVDFEADAEAVRKIINTWVAEQTYDRIKELLPERSLDALTRLVLVNAVYFKAKWEYGFDEMFTKPKPFFVDGKTEVQVPLMYQKLSIGYLKGDDYQAIELPYEGGRLGMMVFLPDAKDGLPAFEKKMTAEGLAKLMGKLQPENNIQVTFPKFSFSWGGAVKEYLQALGMVVPFEDDADFSGMTGKKDLKISEVYHQAFVEVNEAGTEAAAAAAAVMMEKGLRFEVEKPKVFLADHPFLFLIRDRVSGTVLFMGRVTDPRK